LLLGFSINPDTDLTDIRKFLEASNYIQVMGVHPGLAGQKMLETTIPAISYLKRSIQERLYITVDGGVTMENAQDLIKAGANYLIATTAIFGSNEPEENYQKLLEITNDN
jgi:ribulose-phosphate 3-epimerase